MVKLTADLIASAANYLNPLQDRELDLRGYRIPVLEHLGACRDQIDSLNVMDNELRVLGGAWPLLTRLRHVYLANNKLQSIENGFHVNVPFLETLILTNNQLADFKDIRHLTPCRSLRFLSCLGNPISKHKLYRMYLIYHLPQLRVLDFQRIKTKERMAARNYFSNIPPALLHPEQPSSSARPTAEEEEEEEKEESMEPRQEERQEEENPPNVASSHPRPPSSGLSPEDILKIKEAIQNANSLAEIQKLEELLHRGKLPASFATSSLLSSKPSSHDALSTHRPPCFSEEMDEEEERDDDEEVEEDEPNENNEEKSEEEDEDMD